MFTSIAGRSVIVTGSSKGIGKGIARVFASKGARVLVVARHLEPAQATVEAIIAAGGTAAAFSADVGSWLDMQRMAETAVNQFGGIDILCANAGIFPAAKLDDLTAEGWEEVLSTNLKGTFLAVKACLPAMKAKRNGRIVVTSSITGPITGYPGWTHYGASKAGQLGLIHTAAIELAPHNITINAVMPGNIKTEGLDGLGPEYLDKMTASIPMKRLGTVEDIAHAVLFFACDEAAYITGQSLVVDGGQVLPESLMALEEMQK
jgi:3-oxoacyl-[acyl-carrier protein] reductase